jgi:toxin ParE1/3/4
MRVRLSQRSAYHLNEIRAFLARDNPEIAELVRLRILATIERLRKLPGLGHAGRESGTRELRVAGLPLIVVYRVDIGDRDELVILAVFHTAQDR